MLIWKGSRGVRFLASHGLRWGTPPASNGTKGARGTPLLQNCPQGPQGAGAANVRAGAERHPVGWVPAHPAGFLSNVKSRDTPPVDSTILWPIWESNATRGVIKMITHAATGCSKWDSASL